MRKHSLAHLGLLILMLLLGCCFAVWRIAGQPQQGVGGVFKTIYAIAQGRSGPPEPDISVRAESQRLQNLLDSLGRKYRGKVRLAVIDTDTGASASHRGDAVTPSASLYKLFVAYSVYRQLQEGGLGRDALAPGLSLDIETCLAAMITISDNDCGQALGDLAGWSSIDRQLRGLHYLKTTLNNFVPANQPPAYQTTTANDVARFLRDLYDGRLLNRPTTLEYIGWLKAQQLNDWLPAGVPAGTAIAHKTGSLDGYAHDAGIVYGPKRDYVIVVLSGPWPDPAVQAPAALGDISRRVWEALNS